MNFINTFLLQSRWIREFTITSNLLQLILLICGVGFCDYVGMHNTHVCLLEARGRECCLPQLLYTLFFETDNSETTDSTGCPVSSRGRAASPHPTLPTPALEFQMWYLLLSAAFYKGAENPLRSLHLYGRHFTTEPACHSFTVFPVWNYNISVTYRQQMSVYDLNC